MIKTAHFSGVALHYRIAKRNLAVTANHNLVATAHRNNGCSPILIQLEAPVLTDFFVTYYTRENRTPEPVDVNRKLIQDPD